MARKSLVLRHIRNDDGTHRERSPIRWSPDSRTITVDDSYSDAEIAACLDEFRCIVISLAGRDVMRLIQKMAATSGRQ